MTQKHIPVLIRGDETSASRLENQNGTILAIFSPDQGIDEFAEELIRRWNLAGES